MAMSNYLENKLIDHALRGIVYQAPASYHVALFKTDPGETGTGTEATGGGYVRQQVAFAAPVNGVVQSTAEIAFPIATADLGEITHIALFDANAAGNLLFYGPLTTAKFVNTNDQFKMLAGELKVSLD